MGVERVNAEHEREMCVPTGVHVRLFCTVIQRY